MGVANDFWEPQIPGDEYVPFFPPMPEAEIRRWEERHSLRLPASLIMALTVHDGGKVRGTEIRIDPLGGFSVLDDDQWDDHFSPGNQEEVEFEGVDRSKLVMIGDMYGCGLVLDYVGRSEPRVVTMWHDLGGVLRDEGHGTFDLFVEGSRR